VAIIWQKTISRNKYEIRTAGRTSRLYTNGVCHSEYNPEKIITGSIWDLLVLPGFFYSPQQIKRILVLGVGGGAVIRQMLALLQPERVVGVELNPVHLYLSRRFFEIEHAEVELHEADAVAWLENYAGDPFDMIIEDLFTEEKKEPVRAVPADGSWFDTLNRHLTDKGVLVMNFDSTETLNQSACYHLPVVIDAFRSMFRLRTPALDNAVAAFLKIEAQSPQLRRRLLQIREFNKAIKNKKLNYRIQKINK